jgi:hypothetical protein
MGLGTVEWALLHNHLFWAVTSLGLTFAIASTSYRRMMGAEGSLKGRQNVPTRLLQLLALAVFPMASVAVFLLARSNLVLAANSPVIDQVAGGPTGIRFDIVQALFLCELLLSPIWAAIVFRTHRVTVGAIVKVLQFCVSVVCTVLIFLLSINSGLIHMFLPAYLAIASGYNIYLASKNPPRPASKEFLPHRKDLIDSD